MSLPRALWWLAGALVLLFLAAPVLVVMPLSFSTGAFPAYPLPGIGLRWYQALFASPVWRAALWNSLGVALAASFVATALATPAAVGLWRAHFPGRGIALGLILAPLVAPTVISGAALGFAFGRIGLAHTLPGLVLAHAVLAAPFVVLAELAAFARLDRTLPRAAASCGAAPVRVFLQVMLPLAAPGVAAGAVFAFATSLDESVVVLFLAGPGQRTLPRQMFAVLKEQMDLTVLAAATLLVLAGAVLMGATQALRRLQG